MNDSAASWTCRLALSAIFIVLLGPLPLRGDDLPFPVDLVEAETPSYPTFRLRGRVDTDFLWADQSQKNIADFGTLNDRVGLRRARIGGEGNFSPDSRYVAEIDLATGYVIIRDVYVACGDVKETGEFRIGHMREPFSLEGGTSANSFAFMERSPINTLDPARNWGIAYARCGADERWTFTGGLFAAGTDANDFQFTSGSASDITTKWTCLPVYEDHGARLIHLGAVITERIAYDGQIIISNNPRSPLLIFGDSSDAPFTPKIKIPANFQQLINLQWAMINGPLWMQAEWYGTVIAQNGGPPLFYHGCHADIGYFVTGEHRSYLTHSGVFGPVSVQRPLISAMSSKSHAEELGYGALELTARFAYEDFIDAGAPQTSSQQSIGVAMPQIGVGANWYLADRMRIMLNYAYCMPEQVGTGSSAASLFGMRLAVFW